MPSCIVAPGVKFVVAEATAVMWNVSIRCAMSGSVRLGGGDASESVRLRARRARPGCQRAGACVDEATDGEGVHAGGERDEAAPVERADRRRVDRERDDRLIEHPVQPELERNVRGALRDAG